VNGGAWSHPPCIFNCVKRAAITGHDVIGVHEYAHLLEFSLRKPRLNEEYSKMHGTLYM
jgi:hypothetical protein